jgi:hypothetical protein
MNAVSLREAINEQVPTEQVARRYTRLESFGGDGWFHGSCPMADHGDQMPFYISRGGGWRCYECGLGGDVVELEFLCGGYSDRSV